MWYVIVGSIIFWLIYRSKKKKKSELVLTTALYINNSGFEERKRQREQSLKILKDTFKPVLEIDAVLKVSRATLVVFCENHGQSCSEMEAVIKSLNFPNELMKKEAALRKEINRLYKQRIDLKSKVVAIKLSFEHVKLQLENPKYEWKNFAGLQKLQANWKAEEYFKGLLVLMMACRAKFPESPNAKKFSLDIERIFKLWNSQNISRKNFENLIKSYDDAKPASDQHLVIMGIIEYLDRRYKFNPSCKNELVKWCLKDIELYEGFLKDFHANYLFDFDQLLEFNYNPSLKQKKLSAISFERVKKLKNYLVPRLNSYDVLNEIYEKDENFERLQWLKGIGYRIGYINDKVAFPIKVKSSFNYKAITREIEVLKSNSKDKLAFLDTTGEPCSTEAAFKDDAERKGWRVMRAEVSFWQAMFCLTFWDEIFEGVGVPSRWQDIPLDLFKGEEFYLNRQQAIDSRYKQVKSTNLSYFMSRQIKKPEGAWTRLIYDGEQDMLAYVKSDIVQEFVQKVSAEIYAKIVYRIAQNPSENRSGVPDFVIWNDTELRMTEVKRVGEQVRASQVSWLSWMAEENIPAEIVRVKGV